MVLSQRLHEAFKGAVERMTSPRTVSAFKEKGVLTPDEFVQAGDNLVSKCPTWSWEMGDPNKRKSYLPAEKQFLITRNVPCLRRACSIEEDYKAAGGEVLLDNDGDEGWLATHGFDRESKDEDEVVPSMDAQESSARPSRNFRPLVPQDDEDDDVLDMDDVGDDNLVEANDTRHLLQPELVLEDVSQDHAHKTVTIEDHPHMAGKHASIHPCRHGAVMKKIIDVLVSKGGNPEVDKYLFIFLKFVASVIPTIEYDYTMDFELGGQ
ncbi:hypothetical protein KC19_12G050300 [Ceratodon purpureus]|uniref:Autophagy-related protein 3 n=1 Tax=Ceratodon purpureus TaxID=3225 RepID=A0A8T0G4W8_CERPU|nr:hypothetical protein KC19_12G050300 [Ceratodon purpureus]